MASLTGGFEAVNRQLVLILPPLVLDLFLWLGPRLSILPLVQDWLDLLASLPTEADSASAQSLLEALRQSLVELGAGFNLFATLSSAPLGVPSLLAGRSGVLSPAGAPVIWPVTEGLAYLALLGMCNLAGLFAGAVYFCLVAQQVRDGRLSLAGLGRQLGGVWARLIALAVLAALVVFVLGGPTLMLTVMLSLISPWLGNLAALVGLTVILWVLVFAAFTVPGVVLQRRGLFGALWDSLRLVQSNLPPTVGLLTATALINAGLSIVWNLPADDSWLKLVGLGGHALVSTALLAGTFVFYQDRYRWWLELQSAKPGRPEPGL